MTPAHAKRIADWLFVFADPTRLRMVATLAAGEMSSSELCAAAGRTIAQGIIHLRRLREAGVVTVREAGIFHYYSLVAPEVVGGVLSLTVRGVKFRIGLIDG